MRCIPRTMKRTTLAYSICVALILLVDACSSLPALRTDVPRTAAKLVVGPVNLQTAITKSAQMYSFDEEPSPENEPHVLAQLMDETETTAQRLLTEHLTQRPEFAVVQFADTRRLQADLGNGERPWNEDQLLSLGRVTGADIVVDAHILDYGVVRWQYWVTGWLTHASIATTIVGFASAWNPAAIGAYLAVDATTDFPLWWGGAHAFGWAFRPVRIQMHALQTSPCEGLVWTEQELIIKVPGKALAEYSPEAQRRKDVQLQANLNRALASLAESAEEKLARTPCTESGQPEMISHFSIWSILDFLY